MSTVRVICLYRPESFLQKLVACLFMLAGQQISTFSKNKAMKAMVLLALVPYFDFSMLSFVTTDFF